MKILICALTASAIAGFTPTIATAADLGRGYEESETYIERPVPPVRVVRPYYEPDYYYDDAPVVTYYRRPYPYYYAGFYPYWGPRYGYWRGGLGSRLGPCWLGPWRLGPWRLGSGGWGHAGWGRGGWGTAIAAAAGKRYSRVDLKTVRSSDRAGGFLIFRSARPNNKPVSGDPGVISNTRPYGLFRIISLMPLTRRS